MGSRLRADPERIFECCLEITAPDTNASKESTIKFVFPQDYSDQEALKQIPGFCYPCISTSDAVQNYTFVLTDIQGQYRFGFCRYSPNVKTCLCIVSYLPWFETFYALLNTVSELRKKTQEVDVVSLLETLIKLDPPTPGYDVVVKPNESSKEYRFKTLDTDKLPTIPENHNLTDYYAHVEPSNMILLFVSMFFERRIIVTSKKLSVLTACTYGAMSLLYPMHWQHMFVPIVPPHLLDYCCAPMPFLAGVHSSLMPSVRKMPLDEVVILNADTNEVESPFKDIETLPSGVISTLKSTLKKIDLPIHDRVSRAFLSAMVSLVGGYRDALRFKTEKIVFDRDVFIESKSQEKRAFLQLVLHLQLFEQFVSERLELLNSGKGFNDLFEEQIGLQAEDHKKLKHQYKIWMKGAKKYAKVGIHETKQNLKEFGKEAKMNLKQMKGNLEEMLKGKEEEEIGGEIKKSNSLPYMKHYGIGAKMSPIHRRRALSPQPQARKAHSFHQDGDRKVRPQRPPPPKKSVRDRTNAISLVIDGDNNGRQLFTRHSTPNLSTEPPVATLVSLDEDHQPKDTSQDKEKRNTLLDLGEALKDDAIGHVVSPKNQDVSTQPTKATLPDKRPQRSSNPNRPTVPPRPASIKKKSSTSSLNSPGSAVSSPGTPSECLLTPLKPIPIDLQKDIIDSLGPDCQMFFPEWQNRISKINSEITSSTTVGAKNAEHSPTLIDALSLDMATSRNATKVPESSTTSGLKNTEHSSTLIDGLSLDTTTINATKFPESPTVFHEELSNSLELTNKQKNASSNQTQVSIIDTDSSTSEDFNLNSTTSSQPSHWVNFE